MTIASHCPDLLHERGPLTAEELGSECHEAGVTMSRNPTQAVINALPTGERRRPGCVLNAAS
jgi:hypothetical protein